MLTCLKCGICYSKKEQNCFQSNIAKYLINNATVSLFDNFVTSITVYCTFCCISYHNNTVSLDCITSTYWIRAFVWWYRRWPDSQPRYYRYCTDHGACFQSVISNLLKFILWLSTWYHAWGRKWKIIQEIKLLLFLWFINAQFEC